MQSGRLSLGPMLERFERDFAAWLGARGAVAVSSGTAALHLAVRALGWGAGDEVVTSPLSFVASANCLLYEDAVPVFCDIDERTLNIDPAGGRGGLRCRAPPACCRCTCSATRPTWSALEALAARARARHRRGRLRGARRRRRRRHARRRERPPGGLRLLREQAAA